MRAVLDANVLFPTILREILTDLAQAGLYDALWSDRILEEWRRAAARTGPDAESVAGAQIALLRLRFPQAVQPDDGQAAIDLDFPDPAGPRMSVLVPRARPPPTIPSSSATPLDTFSR